MTSLKNNSNSNDDGISIISSNECLLYRKVHISSTNSTIPSSRKCKRKISAWVWKVTLLLSTLNSRMESILSFSPGSVVTLAVRSTANISSSIYPRRDRILRTHFSKSSTSTDYRTCINNRYTTHSYNNDNNNSNNINVGIIKRNKRFETQLFLQKRNEVGTYSTSIKKTIEKPTKQTEIEMTDMSMSMIVAIAVPTIVIFSLAMLLDDSATTTTNSLYQQFISSQDQDSSLEILEESVEKIETLSQVVFKAALPTSATDAFSSAIGEGIAGALGSVSTWIVGVFIAFGKDFLDTTTTTTTTRSSTNTSTAASSQSTTLYASQQQQQQDQLQQRPQISWTNLFQAGDTYWQILEEKSKQNISRKKVFTKLVADSDFFLTRAATAPLLQTAFGFSPIAASVVSVVFATLPYEFIKLSGKQREQRALEDSLMNSLLMEEMERKQKSINYLSNILPWTTKATTSSSSSATTSNRSRIDNSNSYQQSNISTMTPGSPYKIDFVEIFGDVTKWLEYDVLETNFRGKFIYASPGLESAFYGFAAAISSQLYADFIYLFSSYGPTSKKLETKSRSISEWISLYSSRGLRSAFLFGVYESARLPIQYFIMNVMSGGVDSCLGSNDFDLCLETYMFDNPADASYQAQLRSLIVASMNLAQRLSMDWNNPNVNFVEMGRSVAVQLYSLFSNY